MKRPSLAIALAILATLSALAAPSTGAAPAGAALLGRIDYLEGGVSVMRGGKSIGEPDIDTPLQSGDFIKTAADGLVVVALDPSSGMSGTLTVKAKTALYLKIDTLKGEKRTTIELLSGSVGSKVKKLAGAPTMQVSTGSAVMGVRGTEYEVAVALGDAVLILCTEGAVAVTDGESQTEVPAGKVVEKRPGEAFRFVPVAISSIRQFREKWIADEIAAFRADPVRVLANYERRYSELFSRFVAAFEPFQQSAVLRKWMEEDRAGLRVNSLDPQVMREKKEIVGQLIELRKILFIFERVYYRLDEAAALVAGSPAERRELKPGLTVGEFLRRFNTERDNLGRRVFLFRYAEKLYELRNQGGAGMPGMGSDDFFGSDEDFFGSGDF